MNAPVADVMASEAADRLQAAYFRRVLHEQYMELGDKIATHQRLLTECQNGDDVAEATRVRRILREQARELHVVQRLIEALDARFRA